MERMIEILERAKVAAASERAELAKGTSLMAQASRAINGMFKPVPPLEEEIDRVLAELRSLLGDNGE